MKTKNGSLNQNSLPQKIRGVVFAIIIYVFIFFLIFKIISTNEGFLKKLGNINNIIIPQPNYISPFDSIKIIVPLIYLFASIFSGFIFFGLSKLHIAKKYRFIKIYIFRIVIIIIVISSLNYIQSLYFRQDLYNSYIKD